jgi:biopolymer transport protein ExbD
MRIPRDESSDEVFLNLTAFIDMMLVLVIFFLATSRFHEEERDEAIRLAKSHSKLPISTVSDVLIINVDRDGQRIVDGKPRTLEELEEIVRARKAAKEDSEVVVRADERGNMHPFLEVIEVCTRVGFKTPNITYEAAGK